MRTGKKALDRDEQGQWPGRREVGLGGCMWRLGASWAESMSEPSLQGSLGGELGFLLMEAGLTGQPGLRAQQEAGSCLTGSSLRHTSFPHSNPFPLYKAELELYTPITP